MNDAAEQRAAAAAAAAAAVVTAIAAAAVVVVVDGWCIAAHLLRCHQEGMRLSHLLILMAALL